MSTMQLRDPVTGRPDPQKADLVALAGGDDTGLGSDYAKIIQQSLSTIQPNKSYPGIKRNSLLTGLVNDTGGGPGTGRVKKVYTFGLAVVRIVSVGTAGDRIRYVVDAPSDAVADAWLADPVAGTTDTFFDVLEVGVEDVIDFVRPGAVRLDFLNETANPATLYIEAVEFNRG